MAETIHLTLKANGNVIAGESSQHDLGREKTIECLEFKDRVVLEHALAGRKVDLRPIRTGLAHLVIPTSKRAPDKAQIGRAHV